MVGRHLCWLGGTSVGWEAPLLVGEALFVGRHFCWLGGISLGWEAPLLVGRHLRWLRDTVGWEALLVGRKLLVGRHVPEKMRDDYARLELSLSHQCDYSLLDILNVLP